jgi:hypothetical protein
MTFQDYVSSHTNNLRVKFLIKRHHVTEYTSFNRMCGCGGIGKRSISEIEQLQQDYIKTFDVAYQQVIDSIRKRKEISY